MRMKKFFVMLLAVTIAIFVVACEGESKKQSSGTVTEKESSKLHKEKEDSKVATEKESPKTDDAKETSTAVTEKQSLSTVNKEEGSKINDEKESHKAVTEKGISGTDDENELSMAGGGNTVKGVCQFSLGEIYVASKIEPSNNTKSSSFYEVKKQGNTFIDVRVAMENMSNEPKTINDIIATRIKINNNEYKCFPLVESVDGFELQKNALIEPGVVRNIHFVAEVPVSEITNEVEVILTVDGKDFSGKINLEDMKSWNEYKEKMGW